MGTSRRGFLGTTAGTVAGIAITGCSAVPAQKSEWRPSPGDLAQYHLPVMVAGKRVKTIDVHCHCYIPEALSMMGTPAQVQALAPPVRGQKEHVIVVADRLAAMDFMGIDMEVLSINPFWYRRDRASASAITKLQNDKLAELCRANPERFGAFASLPLQFPDLAVQELERAMKMGLRGAAIGGSVNGEDFSQEQFHPVWAKAQELGAVLFIHPQSTPELAKRFKGNGWMSNVIGNPLDTTIALQHLIYEGVLDKFPNLKICAAHGGGYMGSYAPRVDFSCYVSPVNCDPKTVLKKRPSEYIKQIYFDALVFTPEALRHLVAEVGVGQVMLGTDYPIPWELHPVDHVMNTPSLSDTDRAAILGGNAARMFGMKG
ncbi:MAG: amidohydrolase family protein [Pseudomonadota bacterium]